MNKEPQAKTDEFEDKNRVAQSRNIETVTPPINIDDIPEDVRANLIGFDTLELDQMLMAILGGGQAFYSVDNIVLTLWLKYQKKHDRMLIMRRLRALCHSGMVYKIERTRGSYSLTGDGHDVVKAANAGKAPKE